MIAYLRESTLKPKHIAFSFPPNLIPQYKIKTYVYSSPKELIQSLFTQKLSP